MMASTEVGSLFGASILESAKDLFAQLASIPLDERIELLNELRRELHKYSPFSAEPVDCVEWVPVENVEANDYNPNTVAPPEMRLLETSISEDGYTQPIVAWMRDNQTYQVIDGFHRNRVGRESKIVRKRLMGYLPITVVNENRLDRGDRMASTIRHNRARGKHRVESMSDIVVELKRRNWSEQRICNELGMEPDEVLRLCQVSGLAEMFADQNFSRSWDVEGEITEADFIELTDDVESFGEETKDFRTVNTGDENRVFHTYEKWECWAAGFYNNFPPVGMTKASCEEAYRDFLSDLPRFARGLVGVTKNWKHSCEHYLTNGSMNRIAWLGQASMCLMTGVPSAFRSGFSLLSEQQQNAANELAYKALNRWMKKNNRAQVATIQEALADTRQAEIY